MPYTVRILEVHQLTHDVKRFVVNKPENYSFKPGQATEVAINAKGWRAKPRPFTFTSTPSDPTIEFIIKIYSDHEGVTSKLNSLLPGDSLIIHDAWGSIEYMGSGVFIAGGAGITPFISIFRQLSIENKLDQNLLIYANKSEDDIILKNELNLMLGPGFKNVITNAYQELYVNDELTYLKGFVSEEYLHRHIDQLQQYFYVCGPLLFNESIKTHLKALGASENNIILEK